MPEYTWRSSSPDETRTIACELAGLLPERGVVQLTGGLGAGKTLLTAAIVEARNVAPSTEVTSPTFTLIHEYGEPVRIYHIDLYRLESPRELLTLGLEDLYDLPALVLIEWGEKFAFFLPDDRIIIEIDVLGDEQRRIRAKGDLLLPRTSR